MINSETKFKKNKTKKAIYMQEKPNISAKNNISYFLHKDKISEILAPDILVSSKDIFNIDLDFKIPAFSVRSDLVPAVDERYYFDKATILSIISGFVYNKNILIQGYHGTGKSTHIEQVAARLNWPCIRINMDGNISRCDLVGRDAIVIKEGMQITEFRDGILPWSLRRPVALIIDEYDAIRPDVMFILQRLLEAEGRFILPENNEVICPNQFFRIFATSNTIGFGDSSGLYHGVNPINQGQIDRWNMVSTLNYLPKEQEIKVMLSRFEGFDEKKIQNMVQMANLTREGFKAGDLSNVMSLRTLIHWVENYLILNDLHYSFTVTFLNKCELREQDIVAEYYQRCFGVELLQDCQNIMAEDNV